MRTVSCAYSKSQRSIILQVSLITRSITLCTRTQEFEPESPEFPYTVLANLSRIIGSSMGIESKRRKAHFCKFCKRQVVYFSRHLMNRHGSDDDVRKMASAKGAEKMRLLRKIMGDGDLLYNEKNPSTPIVRREASARAEKTYRRLVCKGCNNRISDVNFCVHVARCDSSVTAIKDHRRAARLAAVGNLSHPMDEVVKLMYLKLRDGPVKSFFGEDRLLIEHAAMLSEKYRGESQEKMISSAIRTVCRTILAIRDWVRRDRIALSISKSEECFRPGLYRYFVLAIKGMAGAGKGANGGYQKPSVVDQYGRAFRTFSKTVLFIANEEGTEDLAVHATKWQQVYDSTFSDRVSSIARKQADRKTHELRQAIPMMEDVNALITYVKARLQDAFTALNDRFDPDEYKTLVMTLLLRLWIFNRKRVREVDRLQVKDWNSATQIDPDSVEFHTLLPSEQIYASSFRRICVKGKLGRMVALLLLREDEPFFDLMLAKRAEAGVAPNNPYLFARGDTFVEGTATMRKFADECGAKNPSLLRGTKLRKHLAVCLQYASLTPEDLRQVAETLGHTHETHLKFYRHPLPALHLGRVSKLFAALDAGDFQSIRGRQLGDIEVDTLTVQDELSMSDSIVELAEGRTPRTPEHGDYPEAEPQPAAEFEAVIAQEPSCSYGMRTPPRKRINYELSHRDEDSAEENDCDSDFHDGSHGSDSQDSDSDSGRNVSDNASRSRSKKTPPKVRSNESTQQTVIRRTSRARAPNRVRPYAVRRSTPRVKWTPAIVDCLKEETAEELKKKKLPSSARCRELCALLSARFPDLENLTVARMRTFFSNLFKKLP